MTGQMIIYIGIGVAALSLIGEIVATIVFRNTKKKMVEKIYNSYDQK